MTVWLPEKCPQKRRADWSRRNAEKRSRNSRPASSVFRMRTRQGRAGRYRGASIDSSTKTSFAISCMIPPSRSRISCPSTGRSMAFQKWGALSMFPMCRLTPIWMWPSLPFAGRSSSTRKNQNPRRIVITPENRAGCGRVMEILAGRDSPSRWKAWTSMTSIHSANAVSTRIKRLRRRRRPPLPFFAEPTLRFTMGLKSSKRRSVATTKFA